MLEPLAHRIDHLLEREPGGQVLLGRVADLGVHDPVRGQVLHALTGHPLDRLSVLHHRNGVVERLQVPLQRPGVRRLHKPLPELTGIGPRQLVPDLLRQLHHRLRPQPTIQMVVQQNLRRRLQLLRTDHPAILPPTPFVQRTAAQFCKCRLAETPRNPIVQASLAQSPLASPAPAPANVQDFGRWGRAMVRGWSAACVVVRSGSSSRCCRGRIRCWPAVWWVLLVVRGALPAVFAIAMGWVVGAVQHGSALAGPLT